MNSETDGEIIVRIRRGDKGAFKIIVDRYMKKAFYTALGFVGNFEDAADLSQEAFVRVYKALRRFDINKPFYPWYYKILKNVCLNYQRKKRKIQEVPIELLQQNNSLSSEKDFIIREVWDAISSLGVNEKEVILLKYFQDLTCEEIAQELDCPIGTVMSRLYYARKKLRKKLERVVK